METGVEWWRETGGNVGYIYIHRKSKLKNNVIYCISEIVNVIRN